MKLESSGMILYVAKISYQLDNWFGNCYGGTKILHRHTHTEAHFISLVFLQKCRNKTKNSEPLALLQFKKIRKTLAMPLGQKCTMKQKFLNLFSKL